MAGFADDTETWCLRRLLDHTPDVRAIAAQAFAPPIGSNDIAALRLLLDAGADPNRYRNDDDQPEAPVPAAIAKGCDPELIELLIAHGARDLGTPLTQLEYACLRGDRAGAQRLLAENPALRAELPTADAAALISAAERGKTAVVALLLDAGMPVTARGGLSDATALHAAAYGGSAEVVAQLLAAGAPLEEHDGQWDTTPLDWALVGSGERPPNNPKADWIATVKTLLEAGASTEQIELAPEDPKAPSPEVAELLRSYMA
jgi:ankyrin repeat protein